MGVEKGGFQRDQLKPQLDALDSDEEDLDDFAMLERYVRDLFGSSAPDGDVAAVTEHVCKLFMAVPGIGDLPGVSDDDLFQVPPKRHCPICCLRMPAMQSPLCFTTTMDCCGQILCLGCTDASHEESSRCPFCRAPKKSYTERVKRLEVRMEKGDANSIYTLGAAHLVGEFGLREDVTKGSELCVLAATLGSAKAHDTLSRMNVQNDPFNRIEHLKLAAAGGHEMARHELGLMERKIGNVEYSYLAMAHDGNNTLDHLEMAIFMPRAMKHFQIAAQAGHAKSLKEVTRGYKMSAVSKDDYRDTLYAYKDARDEMKSARRTQAAERRGVFDEDAE